MGDTLPVLLVKAVRTFPGLEPLVSMMLTSLVTSSLSLRRGTTNTTMTREASEARRWTKLLGALLLILPRLERLQRLTVNDVLGGKGATARWGKARVWFECLWDEGDATRDHFWSTCRLETSQLGLENTLSVCVCACVYSWTWSSFLSSLHVPIYIYI